MHELSMAQGILNAVLDTAEANDAIVVTDMIIEIGKLAMLNPEQLKFMLGVLCKDTIAENANIIIEDIDVEIKCHNCGFEGIDRVEVLNGRDVTVKNISIEREDDD